jgi:sortase A
LPTLKKGEPITINFDGIEYRYQVREMLEVSSEDVTVLEQHYDNSYLSLITCVPPGTYLRRLIVRAELVRT